MCTPFIFEELTEAHGVSVSKEIITLFYLNTCLLNCCKYPECYPGMMIPCYTGNTTLNMNWYCFSECLSLTNELPVVILLPQLVDN